MLQFIFSVVVLMIIKEAEILIYLFKQSIRFDCRTKYGFYPNWNERGLREKLILLSVRPGSDRKK